MPNINLNNVTLLTVCCLEKRIKSAIKAIEICCNKIKFYDVKILSHIKAQCSSSIKNEKISKLDLAGYNQFIIKRLNEYVDSEYVLVIQDDGFVVNHRMWDDKFLDCDYIGAYWDFFYTGNRVGNGGFSLRSKKFLDVSSQLDYIPYKYSAIAKKFFCVPEDVFLCRDNYEFMIKNDIKFASESLSEKFSTERVTAKNKFKTFGFHGKSNKTYTKITKTESDS